LAAARVRAITEGPITRPQNPNVAIPARMENGQGGQEPVAGGAAVAVHIISFPVI